MIQLDIFSQRDPRWKDDKYGTSESTIEQLGCVTTCVASILNYYGYETDPKSLDDLLASNDGYHKGSYLIWAKVQELFPKVKFEGRFYSYSNKRAVDWLAGGIPVLVQVDAAPIGAAGKQHWVVFLGDQKAYDPWSCTVTPTDKWIPKGMAAYSGTPKSSQESIPESDLARCIKEKDANWSTYQKEKKTHETTSEELRKAGERIKKLQDDNVDLIKEADSERKKATKYQSEHTDFLQKLANKLTTTADEVAIETEVEGLINKEDKTVELERKLKEEREQYADNVLKLKNEAKILRNKVEELQNKIVALEKSEPEVPPENPKRWRRFTLWFRSWSQKLKSDKS